MLPQNELPARMKCFSIMLAITSKMPVFNMSLLGIVRPLVTLDSPSDVSSQVFQLTRKLIVKFS